jgi:hypothetical protein
LFFVLAWYALGFLGLLRGITFALVPLVGFGVGLRPAFASFRGLYRHRGLLGALRRPQSVTESALLAYGVLCVALVYVPILTPDNIAFDSRWYHMAMAEAYSDAGRITRFPDGWACGAYPQLATILYSWAFELPGGILFDRIELAAHVEFFVFLFTIASIPVLVRRILPKAMRGRTGITWVAIFFFPGVFLYDSNLSGGADHIAALWAIPLFLALLRAQRDLALRPALLLSLLASAVLLTTYTAYGLLAAPALVIAYRIIVLSIRGFRRGSLERHGLVTPIPMIGLILLCTAPHWLKNLLWYRDPLYPMLHELVRGDPWVPEGAARMRFILAPEWTAERSWAGLGKTLSALYDFSFLPNDWQSFHGMFPVFGSLFTLTAPFLIFLTRARKLILLYVAAHVSVLYWYWTFHQDRYLQATLPWMAAGTAAVLVGLLRFGWWARVGCALLVGAQVVWGGDVPFFPTHVMVATTPYKTSIDFLSGGYRGLRDERFVVYGTWTKLAEELPEDATVLLHDEPLRLGIGAPAVTDWYQVGISYVSGPYPDQVYERLDELGVTHIVSRVRTSRAQDTLGGDIAFFHFLTVHARAPRPFGAWLLSAMPEERPERDGFNNRALVLGCGEAYASGLYAISDLSVPPLHGIVRPKSDFPKPLSAVRSELEMEPFVAEADAIVHEASCFVLRRSPSFRGFVLAATRDTSSIWIRKDSSLR